ncbi:MAG TPA: hypothetical protein VGN42_19900 [Pirellulales bacterium]|nr:hypothetical protein [Pirellulales bacterium]
MPEIRVSMTLPYALRLAEGQYATAQGDEVIHINAPPLEEVNPQTIVAAVFQRDEIHDQDQMQKARVQDADRLLRRTNRMLRWYRAVRQRADITELTRAQASPFRFEVVGPGDPAGWTGPIEYEEVGPAPLALTVEQLTKGVRDGLASGRDPDVDVLFLLDAERALQQGRFREAVLFCWSTIDSVFNRKYDSLVDAALTQEWGEARTFFKGLDLGLKTKMSAGMRFVANRSLFNEPDDLWQRMSASYAKRNHIIHRGENATEDEAHSAIKVARKIVEIINGIPVPLVAVKGGNAAAEG